MKIGIDAMNIRRGGGVTHLVELLKAANPVTHGISEITVWTIPETASLLPERTWLKIVVNKLAHQSILGWLAWQRTFLSSELSREYDILFIPGGLYVGSFRPYVTMSRNLLPFDIKERRRFGWTSTRLRYHALEKAQAATFRRASGIIFLTREAQRVTEKRIGSVSSRKIVIPHGVSDTFRRKPREAREMSEITQSRPFRWLYVSIINWYKHQWNVAEAVARLKAEGYPIRLDLVGPAYGPALKHLRSILRKIDPKGETIYYHGSVPYEELDEYYRGADGFVFASTCETFGQILVEAMSAGLPIACSNQSAMPELLADAGLYFDPEKPGDIADVLKKYMDDVQLRRQAAIAAYERAQNFSWKICAERTFEYIASFSRKLNS